MRHKYVDTLAGFLESMVIAGWDKKMLALWQGAVFIKYFACYSVNRRVLNGPQLTCNATKCLFGTLKGPCRGYLLVVGLHSLI